MVKINYKIKFMDSNKYNILVGVWGNCFISVIMLCLSKLFLMLICVIKN